MGRRVWEIRKPTGWLTRGRLTGGGAGRAGGETGLDTGRLCCRQADEEPPKEPGVLLWLELECRLGPLLQEERLDEEPEE